MHFGRQSNGSVLSRLVVLSVFWRAVLSCIGSVATQFTCQNQIKVLMDFWLSPKYSFFQLNLAPLQTETWECRETRPRRWFVFEARPRYIMFLWRHIFLDFKALNDESLVWSYFDINAYGSCYNWVRKFCFLLLEFRWVLSYLPWFTMGPVQQKRAITLSVKWGKMRLMGLHESYGSVSRSFFASLKQSYSR